MNKYSLITIENIAKRSKQFTDEGLVFGPHTGYISPDNVRDVVEWYSYKGYEYLYFMGGQSDLLEVLDEFDHYRYSKMYLDHLIEHIDDDDLEDDEVEIPVIRLQRD